MFFVGAMVSWNPIPSQEIAIMVSNSYNSQPSYPNVEKAAHPLSYILNWNGSMFHGIFNTRWAGGIQTMAKDKYSIMVTLGQKLALSKFQIYVDYMGEFDQIDRLGIVTSDLGIRNDVQYHSFISKFSWQFAPKWNLVGKGTYELASVNGYEALKNYRQSIGWVGSVEFLPAKDQDLRFFLAYLGHNHHFTRASGASGNNHTAHSVQLGFIYRLKAY